MVRAAVRSNRRHLRYKPENVTYAEIQIGTGNGKFKAQVVGFVFSEAYGGCGLVVPAVKQLRAGDECVVKVANLSPLRAKVAWRQELDEHVMKLGCEFLE